MIKEISKVLVGVMLGLATVVGGTALAQTAGGGGFGNQDASFNPAVIGSNDGTASNSLLQVIRNFINWGLGLLGLIALIMLLWGGFQMVTAGGADDKYKVGFKIMKQAAIGIIFIGVAWLFVMLIFRVVGSVGGAGVQG
ncbi:MAG: hypothetical protein V3575_00890 [Candidatus Absconditabacteria bacterium]